MAFFSLLITLSSFLFAGNQSALVAQPLVGTFLKTGNYQVLQERTTTIVDPRMSDSQEIIQALKNQGFRCGKKVQVYRCIKFAENPQIDPNLHVEPFREKIEFGAPKSLTDLNEANEVTQFFIHQDIYIDNNYYEKAWYTITDRFNKVRAGADNHPEPIHLLFKKGSVAELQFYNVTHSRFSWTDYIVQVEYR
jgi:hypothetical protein